MIIYTDMIPQRFAGLTIACLILIRPSRRGDDGLLAHEQVHVDQFRRTYGLFCLQYLFSRKWRFRYEVEAYARQVDFAKDKPRAMRLYAASIADNYGLHVSFLEAMDALQAERRKHAAG